MNKKYTNDNINALLKKVSRKVRKNNPELNRRREILERDGISIDEVIEYFWGYDKKFDKK
jgi:hypothetical protein